MIEGLPPISSDDADFLLDRGLDLVRHGLRSWQRGSYWRLPLACAAFDALLRLQFT